MENGASLAMRVLVVDDEIRVAENIAAALRENAGLAVDVANSGPDGVEFARQTGYDLILLDLMLPGMDGLQVLRAMRAAGQSAPVLVLTAVAEKASVVSLLNAGADDYLAKPFDLGELLARAKALIRRSNGVSHPKIQVADLIIDTIEKTVSVGVTSELIRGDVFFWGALMAGALLGSIPVAVIYSFFVEHYVAGLTGSVKG